MSAISKDHNLFSVFTFSLTLTKMGARTSRFKAIPQAQNQSPQGTTIKHNEEKSKNK